jgi:hypothetical protein
VCSFLTQLALSKRNSSDEFLVYINDRLYYKCLDRFYYMFIILKHLRKYRRRNKKNLAIKTVLKSAMAQEDALRIQIFEIFFVLLPCCCHYSLQAVFEIIISV